MAIKGERLGRFVLERRLGRGLAGEVWKGRDGGPGGPPAAVKIFSDHPAIDAIRKCGVPTVPSSPNLCGVIDAAPDNNPPYFATDLVEGPTLREIMGAQKFVPLSAAIPCLIQIVRGLAALHKEKLAHHDLRPENVILDELGTVKLCDVATEAARRESVARLIDRKHPAPLPPERAAERLPYVAPELRRGVAPGPIDGPRADMYAFGVIAYELLTGSRPNEGLDIKYPSQKDKRIPKVLDETVLRCLERTLRTRTPTALGVEAPLLEGLERAGFHVYVVGDAVKWVRATPWRAVGAPAGEETGRFTSLFKKLAEEKK